MTPPAAVATALDAVLEPWKAVTGPGGAATVRSADGWTWRRAVGSADVQSRVANTLETRFRAGSISKQFLCAVVFDLAREGRIDLDASVRRHLPELNEGFEPVRVLNLTDHTSGVWCHITTGLLVNGRGPYPPPSDDEVFDLVAGQRATAFPPGARASYSNGGSVLLSRLVERVEAKPLELVFRDRLFGPIGMSSTSLVRRDSDLEPGLAVCHVPLRQGGFERGYMPFPMAGEGGVVSSLDDMLAWLAHWERPTAFAPEVVAQMEMPVRLASGFQPTFRRGVMHTRYRGHDILFHDGGVIGGYARAARIPSLGLHLVVFANRGDASLNRLGRALIDAAAGERLSEPAPAPPADPWQGAFHRRGSVRVCRFRLDDGTPMVDINGQAALLIADGEGQRCDTPETTDIRFSLSADGEVLTVDDRGEREAFIRLPEGYAPSAADRGALAGEYLCEDLRASASIDLEDGEGSAMEIRGPLGLRRYRLSPLAAGLWRMDPTDPPASRAASPILEVTGDPGAPPGFRVGNFRATVEFARRA